MTNADIKHLITAFTVALEQVLAKAQAPQAQPQPPVLEVDLSGLDAIAQTPKAQVNPLDRWIATLSTTRRERGGKLYRSEAQRAQARYGLLKRGLEAGWTDADLRDALSLSKAHLLFALDNRLKPSATPWKIPEAYVEKAKALRKR